ncbi:MAG: biopolymer transporter ExbD [Endozoicomonadaceae bacterium]|nr:biopolymer transporter ExbD [Endozoicomonadaceae bacterium]
MKFRRQRNEEVSVNLTPLIDVVFLLLIFFMVSTTFTRETQLTIDLPEATGKKVPTLQRQIEIAINKGGHITVNGDHLVSGGLQSIKQALIQASQGNTQLPLAITADATTPHQAVVTAMAAAGELGFSHLSITTQEPVSQ